MADARGRRRSRSGRARPGRRCDRAHRRRCGARARPASSKHRSRVRAATAARESCRQGGRGAGRARTGGSDARTVVDAAGSRPGARLPRAGPRRHDPSRSSRDRRGARASVVAYAISSGDGDRRRRRSARGCAVQDDGPPRAARCRLSRPYESASATRLSDRTELDTGPIDGPTEALRAPTRGESLRVAQGTLREPGDRPQPPSGTRVVRGPGACGLIHRAVSVAAPHVNVALPRRQRRVISR